MIEAEELEDASEGREDLKGSVMAKLQKKLLVNTVTVLFDLLGRTNNKEAVAQSGAYLSGALYQMFRLLYRAPAERGVFFHWERQLQHGYCVGGHDAGQGEICQGAGGIPGRVSAGRFSVFSGGIPGAFPVDGTGFS